MLAELISAHGSSVEVVRDGRHVLETAHAYRPDVVLLDLGLPGLDGYQVASSLRADGELTSVKLVACTGYSVRDHSPTHLFDARLVKPVVVESLIALLVEMKPQPQLPRSLPVTFGRIDD